VSSLDIKPVFANLNMGIHNPDIHIDIATWILNIVSKYIEPKMKYEFLNDKKRDKIYQNMQNINYKDGILILD